MSLMEVSKVREVKHFQRVLIEINNFSDARPFYFIMTAYYYPQYLAQQTYQRKTKDFSFDQVIYKRVLKSMGLFILFYFSKEFRLISFVLFFFLVSPEIRSSSTWKTSYIVSFLPKPTVCEIPKKVYKHYAQHKRCDETFHTKPFGCTFMYTFYTPLIYV